MVAHEIGDRRMNSLRTVVYLYMINSMKVLLWFGREGQALAIEGYTDLYVIRNMSVTGVSYRDEILVSIIIPYSDAVSDDFIKMDANAKPGLTPKSLQTCRISLVYPSIYYKILSLHNMLNSLHVLGDVLVEELSSISSG